jgi:hypothetical protein
MIRKDNQIRYGSIRLICTGNTDGLCRVIPVYGTTVIGAGKRVPEEVLLDLQREGEELARLLAQDSIAQGST